MKSDLTTLKTSVNSIKTTVDSLNTAITSTTSNIVTRGGVRVDLGYARTFNPQTLMSAQAGIPGYTDSIAAKLNDSRYLTLSSSSIDDAGYVIWKGTDTSGVPLGRFYFVMTFSGALGSGYNSAYSYHGFWYTYYWNDASSLRVEKTSYDYNSGENGVSGTLYTIAPIV